MNKKQLIVLLAVACALTAHERLVWSKVTLTSRFLGLVDGAFVTGEIVGLNLQVRKILIEMMEGKRLPDGTCQGLYRFEGELHSLRSLEKVEAKLFEEREQLDNKLKSALTDEDKRKINSDREKNGENIKRVEEILEKAKKDFQDTVNVFIDRARTAKEPMIMLINEFCDKANRPDSLLLDWANLEGDEEEVFNKGVNTLKIFNWFATDLTDFLEALIRGCPKAQQQFKKLIHKKSR